MVPLWLRLVPPCFRLLPIGFRFGSGALPPPSGALPVASALVPVCFRYASGMLPVCPGRLPPNFRPYISPINSCIFALIASLVVRSPTSTALCLASANCCNASGTFPSRSGPETSSTMLLPPPLFPVPKLPSLPLQFRPVSRLPSCRSLDVPGLFGRRCCRDWRTIFFAFSAPNPM